MATGIIIILFLLAGISALTRYKKTTITFFVFGLVLFFALGTSWIPTHLLNPLESPYKYLAQPTWGVKNAIVVLGGGSRRIPNSQMTEPTIYSYSRLNQAAQLYLSCQKTEGICKIIISGGDGMKIGTPETVSYRTNLLRLGVNDADIILENKSLNTRDNAKNTSVILKAQAFDYVVLVTSAVHLKRALSYFSLYDIYPVPAPADYLVPVKTYLPVAYNLTFCDFALHEYAGMAQYYFYKLRNQMFS